MREYQVYYLTFRGLSWQSECRAMALPYVVHNIFCTVVPWEDDISWAFIGFHEQELGFHGNAMAMPWQCHGLSSRYYTTDFHGTGCHVMP